MQHTTVLCTNTISAMVFHPSFYWKPTLYLRPGLYCNKCNETPRLVLETPLVLQEIQYALANTVSYTHLTLPTILRV